MFISIKRHFSFFSIAASLFVKGTYIRIWRAKHGKQEWASVRHLWREREREQQRETSMSFQAPSHGLLECWWAPGVWGNVLSPSPTHTHWSSPSHWSWANDGPLAWPTENGAVKVSECVQLCSLPIPVSSGQTWLGGREQGPQTNVKALVSAQCQPDENRCGEYKCPSVSGLLCSIKQGQYPAY